MHAPVEAVRELIAHAESDVSAADSAAGLHRAQQVLLLVRLAADCGARRGELAALRVDDLDGDVLTIARGTSCEVVGPTKTTGSAGSPSAPAPRGCGEARSGPGANAPRPPAHREPAGSGRGCSPPTPPRGPVDDQLPRHWFADLADRAGHGDITLHRLRHTVATVLVGHGDLLQAQYRLGHRDASTTLRIYSHVLPLTDAQAAATFDQLYP
jgi:integrase